MSAWVPALVLVLPLALFQFALWRRLGRMPKDVAKAVADDCRTQIAAAEGRAQRAEAQITDAPARIADLRDVSSDLRETLAGLRAVLVERTERAVGAARALSVNEGPRSTIYPEAKPAPAAEPAPAAQQTPAAATEPDAHQRKTVRMEQPPDGCTPAADDDEPDGEATVVVKQTDLPKAAAKSTPPPSGLAAPNGLRIGGGATSP